MSINTELLAKARAAYESALQYQSAHFGDRRHDNHDIDILRNEMLYWEQRVAAEEARAAGSSSRRPFQMVI